ILVVGRVNPTDPALGLVVVVLFVMVGGRACHGPFPNFSCGGRQLPATASGRAPSTSAISALLAPPRSLRAAASHVIYCASLTTRMAIGMKAWSLPQSSEHCP